MSDPLLENAKRLHQAGNLAEAMKLYRQVLRADPLQVEAIGSLAMAHFQRNEFEEAQRLFGEVARLGPQAARALCFQGVALLQLERWAEALTSFDAALASNPNFVEAMTNRATALLELQRPQEALEAFDATLRAGPANANAWNNRGNALLQMERAHEAVASYERALVIDRHHAEAWNNRGNALAILRRYDDAMASFGNAIAIRPDYAEAWEGRARVLSQRWQFPEALAAFDRAIAIRPEAELYESRAEALFLAGRIEDAVRDCERALKMDPHHPYTTGNHLFWRLACCDWRGLDADIALLAERIEKGERAAYPFMVLATPLSAATQRKAAELFVQDQHPRSSLLPPLETGYDHARIRLGYFSSDFRDHATAYLMAELIERHDRTKFEVIGFSLGHPQKDAMRARLEKSFDRFIDANALSSQEVALLARKLEIDIAIDLKGFTQDSRTDIFALGAAPVQVSYLGYPGTMGAFYIDYLIADPTLIPEEQRQHYAEKIAWLPDTYQVNDSRRAISDIPFTKTECGLPEDGFVFCSFNNSYKITPEIFDIWMRLLTRVEGSVLWLLEGAASAMKNLRAEAGTRGVAPDRIVFAKRIDLPRHLARQRLADLFLDTLPYNAHTTASDALWAGVPVLTCLGETFAGRVAASLLGAIGLPELVTRSPDAYEQLALELAARPEKLRALRQKLAANRLTEPLFDTARFALHLEAAYAEMWRRQRAGLAPDHIEVQPAEKSP